MYKLLKCVVWNYKERFEDNKKYRWIEAGGELFSDFWWMFRNRIIPQPEYIGITEITAGWKHCIIVIVVVASIFKIFCYTNIKLLYCKQPLK